MRYVEAPDTFEGNGPSLFLAGGISGAAPWQEEIVQLLEGTEWTVLNPRRRVFPEHPDAAREQIAWEYVHLRRATARLFWFPPQTLCPIALFELGAWSRGTEPLFVGVDPAYQRRLDVEIQLSLARPEVRVVTSVRALAEQAIAVLEKNATTI
ncbi:MAG: nucleoside 2-deoxyribosyltransferase domain-containing protein [Phycisphaerae bacterium]